MFMMGFWKFEVTIISAADLLNVRHLPWHQMKVYAEVSINNNKDPKSMKKTRVDLDGGTCPRWNEQFSFDLSEESIEAGNDKLVILLRCERSILGPKDIGEVTLSLKDLFEKKRHEGNHHHDQGHPDCEEYEVMGRDEDEDGGIKRVGVVKLSYRFRKQVMDWWKAILVPFITVCANDMASHFLKVTQTRKEAAELGDNKSTGSSGLWRALLVPTIAVCTGIMSYFFMLVTETSRAEEEEGRGASSERGSTVWSRSKGLLASTAVSVSGRMIGNVLPGPVLTILGLYNKLLDCQIAY